MFRTAVMERPSHNSSKTMIRVLGTQYDAVYYTFVRVRRSGRRTAKCLGGSLYPERPADQHFKPKEGVEMARAHAISVLWSSAMDHEEALEKKRARNTVKTKIEDVLLGSNLMTLQELQGRLLKHPPELIEDLVLELAIEAKVELRMVGGTLSICTHIGAATEDTRRFNRSAWRRFTRSRNPMSEAPLFRSS